MGSWDHYCIKGTLQVSAEKNKVKNTNPSQKENKQFVHFQTHMQIPCFQEAQKVTRSQLSQFMSLNGTALTQKCENQLQRVQKSALRIILDNKYVSYDDALKVLKLQSLKERREDLCLKFAQKCLQVPKFVSQKERRNQRDHNTDKRRPQSLRRRTHQHTLGSSRSQNRKKGAFLNCKILFDMLNTH